MVGRAETWSSSARVALTKHHKLGRLTSGHLFLMILEAGKSEIRVPIWLSSGEDFVACRHCLLAVSKHVGERVSSLSLIRAQIPS